MSETPNLGTAGDASLRLTLLIAYALFVLAVFNGATAIAGVVLVYLRVEVARGTIWESHCRNLTQVFWVSLFAVAAISAIVLGTFSGFFFSLLASNGQSLPPYAWLGFLLVPVLALACIGFTIWYLYRTLRGAIRALEDKPY